MDVKSEYFSGHLYKWTNYIKGYQKRWFVLQNAFVSYYRNPNEMGHTCRGTINLINATVTCTGSTTFVISNSSTQTFHLKAARSSEQKKWVAALLDAKAKALTLQKDSGEDSDAFVESDEGGGGRVINVNIGPDEAVRLGYHLFSKLENKLDEVNRCQASLVRKNDELHFVISELEGARDPSELTQRFTSARDRLALYKAHSIAMIDSCKQFTSSGRDQLDKWRRVFVSQKERCALLEQMIEELAKQLRQLELLVKQNNPHACLTLPGFNTTPVDGARLPSIPGQAVRVNRWHPEPESTSKCSTSSDSMGASSGQRNNPPKESRPDDLINMDRSSPSLNGDSSDDDFYDAEELGSEFSIYLPSTPLTASNGSKSIAGAPEMVDQSAENHSSSMLVLSPDEDDGFRPSGTDAAFEYESDVESIDAGDVMHRTASNKLSVLCEARVIQPRPGKGHKSRTGTLIPGEQPAVRPQVRQVGAFGEEQEKSEEAVEIIIPKRKLGFTRRTEIPFKPNYSLNLWSIMKNCIGKELTKIPMPVNFSEPLSMLQRLTENFEYSACLDRAAACEDSLEQMVHVAAFTVSSYSTTAMRVNKPFNPLLGETYECDRTDDFGWRSLAEQVSHHPPKCAVHCESDSWYCWFEFSMNTKFRGKYLQINPLGTVHLVFRKSGNHYTWKNIPLTVHNIIVGRLWIDNSGEMDIVNHTTGDKCHLSYRAYSYFSSETPRRVTGAVTNKAGSVQYVLNGAWDEYMDYAPVLSTRKSGNGKPVLETGPSTTVWRSDPLPPDSERMYYFTRLALQLNQEEEGVCPTDCRFRPDQRLMELGRWDEANQAKVVLEEKQRSRRRQMAARLAESFDCDDDGGEQSDASRPNSKSDTSSGDSNHPRASLTHVQMTELLDQIDSTHKPLWFERNLDPHTGEQCYYFTETYWDCKAKSDWSMCPNIY